MSDEKSAELSFEAALARLEKVVSEMESGDAPLEMLIARFEEGTQLSNYCRQKLDALQQKIEILAKDDGKSGEWASLDAAESTTEVSAPQKNRSVRAVEKTESADDTDELPF